MAESFTRRNLPHWYVPGAAHFVTYRLAGTIPQSALLSWRDKRNRKFAALREAGNSVSKAAEIAHKQFFLTYDQYLDKHTNVSWLSEDPVAEIVRDNLYHHDGTKYYLLAFSIMPNHVHTLFQPIADDVPRRPHTWLDDEREDRHSPLSKVMHALKSYTANRANKVLGRTGAFWQHESYDHWVRDDDELERIVHYINANPVNAGLVERVVDWRFGSAHDRFVQDGFENGMLLQHS